MRKNRTEIHRVRPENEICTTFRKVPRAHLEMCSTNFYCFLTQEFFLCCCTPIVALHFTVVTSRARFIKVSAAQACPPRRRWRDRKRPRDLRHIRQSPSTGPPSRNLSRHTLTRSLYCNHSQGHPGLDQAMGEGGTRVLKTTGVQRELWR